MLHARKHVGPELARGSFLPHVSQATSELGPYMAIPAGSVPALPMGQIGSEAAPRQMDCFGAALFAMTSLRNGV